MQTSRQLTLVEVEAMVFRRVVESCLDELSAEIDENYTDVLVQIESLEDKVKKLQEVMCELKVGRQLTWADIGIAEQEEKRKTLNEWAKMSSVLPLRVGDEMLACVALRKGKPEGLFPEFVTLAVRDTRGGELAADYVLMRSSIERRR